MNNLFCKSASLSFPAVRATIYYSRFVRRCRRAAENPRRHRARCAGPCRACGAVRALVRAHAGPVRPGRHRRWVQCGAVCRRGAAVRARVGALLAAGGRCARRPGGRARAHGCTHFRYAARARSRPAPAHVGHPHPRRAAGNAHAGARILARHRQPALSRHRARWLPCRRRPRPRRAARVPAGLPARSARSDAARPVRHLRGAAHVGAVLRGCGVRGLPAAAARPAAPRAPCARCAFSRSRRGAFSLPRP